MAGYGMENLHNADCSEDINLLRKIEELELERSVLKQRVELLKQERFEVEARRTQLENNVSGQWAHDEDEIRIWASSIKLNGGMPSKKCFRELLYGDSSNSAHDADVIVIYLAEFHLDKAYSNRIRGLLRASIENPGNYVFNEDDQGLGIRGIPADFTRATDHGKNMYCGLYVCVHRRLLADTDDNDRLELSDTFPTPPVLTCGAPDDHHRSDDYDFSRSLFLQNVTVKVPFTQRCGTEMGPLHLVIVCGELSEHFAAQQFQVLRLQRHLHMLRKLHEGSSLPFTALFIGNTNHRIVASADFMDHIEEIEPEGKKDKKKNKKDKEKKTDKEGKQKNGKKSKEPLDIQYRLKPSGVTEIVRRLEDPLSRHHLFRSTSLHFTGKDCFGRLHESPPLCAMTLRNLFELSIDWMLRKERWVPLPTSSRTSLEASWSSLMGFQVQLPEVVTAEMLQSGTKALHLPGANTPEEIQEWYLPSTRPEGKVHSRVLKSNLGDALYMQIGWLDGLGVYKDSTCQTALTSWHTHEDLYCSDHVPVKGSVELLQDGFDPVRVWVGSMKLDHRYPSKSALREFLYGTPDCSAKGADVIALFMTDIDVQTKTVKQLQNFLFKTLLEEERDQYFFNEQDEGLTLKALPVTLVKIDRGKTRYIGLFVCAKKSLCGDFNDDGEIEVDDIFPFPPELICRSDMKNEAAPSFKGHMAQNVVLSRNGKVLHLLLVGANFETEDSARARQMDRLIRYLEAYHREQKDFAAVLFGDFNNRAVCPEWLAPHVSWKGEGGVTGAVLSNSGAKELCTRLASEGESLMRSMDSWFFTGQDVTGTELAVPDAQRILRDKFQLHIDLPFHPGTFPRPTYKRASIGEMLSSLAGFQIDLGETVLGAEVANGIARLKQAVAQLGVGICSDVPTVFFGSESSEQRTLVVVEDGQLNDDLHEQVDEDDVDNAEPTVKESWPMINCGWPDVIGVFRSSVFVQAELLTCAPCETVFGAINHTPIRGKIRITLQ